MAVGLWDLDAASLHQVLNHLPGCELCRVAATCRSFRDLVFEGSLARQRWQAHCTNALATGLGAIHAAAAAGDHRDAQYWRLLFGSTQTLNSVRWWRQGTLRLRTSVEEADKAAWKAAKAALDEEAALAAEDNEDGMGYARSEMVLSQAAQLRTKLARTGHTGTVAGRLLVVAGGIIRDGFPDTHVLVVTLDTLDVCIPEVRGLPPAFRFRHTTVLVDPAPGSLLHRRIGAALGVPSPPALAGRPQGWERAGHLLLLYGGYNTRGEEFGGASLEALWVHHDGKDVTWIPLHTTGDAPSPRHHHSADLFNGKSHLVVFGGEGPAVNDTSAPAMTDPFAVSCCRCYVLDIHSLHWRHQDTHSITPGDDPGARSLHCTTVRTSPVTAREELVLFGGYCNGGLAEMHPFTLDLTTFCWSGSHGPQAVLPAPRQRTACVRVTRDWLLMLAGGPMQGELLDDLQRLHVPTLTWMGPPSEILGRPGRALRSIAGHSFSGLIAFGGCIATALGIVPIAKMDILLIGRPPAPLQLPAVPQPAPLAATSTSSALQPAAASHTAKRPQYGTPHTSASSSSGLSWTVPHYDPAGVRSSQVRALLNPPADRLPAGTPMQTPLLNPPADRLSGPALMPASDVYSGMATMRSGSASSAGELDTGLTADMVPSTMAAQTSANAGGMPLHIGGNMTIWRDPVTGRMYAQHAGEPAPRLPPAAPGQAGDGWAAFNRSWAPAANHPRGQGHGPLPARDEDGEAASQAASAKRSQCRMQ